MRVGFIGLLHFTSRLFQRLLEFLTAHASINHGVPVHQLDRTCGQSLRKLIHCRGCLLTTGTGSSSKVSDTLNGCRRFFQANACRRKSTNISRHFGEIINGLIGVSIQLVNNPRDISHRSAFAGGIRQNRLNSIDFGFIFAKTRHNRLDSKSFYHLSARCHSLISNVLQSSYTENTHCREFRGNMFNIGSDVLKGKGLTNFTEFVKILSRRLQI